MDIRDLKEDLDKLIGMGKKKGFLTYDEVNTILSDKIDSSEDIDQVFDILDGKNIKVIESEDIEVEEPEVRRDAEVVSLDQFRKH